MVFAYNLACCCGDVDTILYTEDDGSDVPYDCSDCDFRQYKAWFQSAGDGESNENAMGRCLESVTEQLGIYMVQDHFFPFEDTPPTPDQRHAACTRVRSDEAGCWANLFEFEDRVGIVFNGTSTAQHVLVDLDITMAPLAHSLEGAGADEFVHQGFNAMYCSMHEAIAQWLTGEADSRPERRAKPILLSGHSMGGALATLCMRYLAEDPYLKERRNKICLFTFGSPCVGNQPFATKFGLFTDSHGQTHQSEESRRPAIGEAWRVVAEADMIPASNQGSIRSNSLLLSCLLACCMPCIGLWHHRGGTGMSAREMFWKACSNIGESETYVHAGAYALFSSDGLLALNPSYVDSHFRRRHNRCCHSIGDHFAYAQLIRAWISKMHGKAYDGFYHSETKPVDKMKGRANFDGSEPHSGF